MAAEQDLHFKKLFIEEESEESEIVEEIDYEGHFDDDTEEDY